MLLSEEPNMQLLAFPQHTHRAPYPMLVARREGRRRGWGGGAFRSRRRPCVISIFQTMASPPKPRTQVGLFEGEIKTELTCELKLM